MKLLRMNVVLAAIDYDDASHAVLDAARQLAEAGGADLHAVHVDTPRSAGGVAAGRGNRGSIDTAVALLHRAKVEIPRARVHVIPGEPVSVMRDLADRVGADVIVLGPHRAARHADGRLGGTAVAIATTSSAPCLIVTHGLRLPLRRVLVPVDLSDTARGALVAALSWSSALRGGRDTSTELTALYVAQNDGAAGATASAEEALTAELDRVRREAGSWAGIAIDGVTVPASDVPGAIADRARELRADLVVLGTRGIGLDAVGRLGSVSAEVSRRVDAPVLLVPPAVWTAIGESRH